MKKILLIKLGALGDVLRTTPLLQALRKKYPDCEITWIVDAACREVLEGNARIDRLWSYGPGTLDVLKKENFDLSVNLDKDDEALDASMAARADQKRGFGRSAEGGLCALDAWSDYAYRLGVDDELKFRKNRKTYQEISFEQLGLKFGGEEYDFPADPAEDAFARAHLQALGVPAESAGRRVVGLNTGSGHRFAGKRLPVESWIELGRLFWSEMDASVLLLGGRDEKERNETIVKKSPYPIVDTGAHSIRRFAGLVRACDLVISGDTTAMHIAIAVKTPVVAYFASTCPAEIELYGRGKKVVSDISCAPCYLRSCPIDEQCMKEMRPAALFEAAKSLLGGVRVGP